MRKKVKKETKLQLHRETLRALAQIEEARLERVDGASGFVGTSCINSCYGAGVCVLK
jgi:hypothetical protein